MAILRLSYLGPGASGRNVVERTRREGARPGTTERIRIEWWASDGSGSPATWLTGLEASRRPQRGAPSRGRQENTVLAVRSQQFSGLLSPD